MFLEKISLRKKLVKYANRKLSLQLLTIHFTLAVKI